MMNSNNKIFIAGHKGLAGSAIHRKLVELGYTNLIVRNHEELDLENQKATNAFFVKNKPEYVFLAAAKVGGIHANNTYKADFIYNNLMIQCNVINAAYENSVKRLIFLGSTCIYPRLCDQPMREDSLLSGPLEPTNESYAIAKIAGVKMIEAYNLQHSTNYLAVMPTNMYGKNDNFNLENGHVLPVLIRKFHEAKQKNDKEIVLWGSGTAKREFLHSDDMADAVIFLAKQNKNPGLINVGTGQELSIRELAFLISDVVGFKGEIKFDSTKPDGTPRKLSNTSKINSFGWTPKIELRKGLEETYKWMIENNDYKK
jgi:GDP-L-fucose synthase